jgi:Ni,Fe-hydrogenase III component G
VNDVYSYAVEEKVLGERTYHVEVHKNALGNANVEEFIKDITNQTYSHLKSLFRADREELEKKFSFVFEIVD